MEDLNNRQMVLLTMFTAFVVSIATGIITVAMLQEAPPTLTQTVNHVVEHTIERVITGTTTPEKPAPMTTITKEVTVFAKEDDLVISAVEKNQPRMAKIFSGDRSSGSEPLAVGFVVSRDGLIAASASDLLTDGVAQDAYAVELNGKQYTASPMQGQVAGKQPVFFLRISNLTASGTLDAVSFGGSAEPKPAQTLVVLGGSDGTSVFKTTISKLRYAHTEATATPPLLTGVEITPKIPDQYSGGLAVNLDGQAVGIVVPDPNAPQQFIVYPALRFIELLSGASGAGRATGATEGGAAAGS